MGDSALPVEAVVVPVVANAIPLSQVPVATPLDPPTARELSERQAIVATARTAQKRGTNMRGLLKTVAKTHETMVLQGEARVSMPPGMVPRARRFFEALSKLGDVGRAAASVGLSAQSGSLHRWRRQYGVKLWDECVVLGREWAEDHRPPDWAEVEGFLAEIVRSPRHRDQLKAIELWARLEGRLDTKVQVEVSRSTLEAKLQEALTTYGTAVNLLPANTPASDNAHSTSSTNPTEPVALAEDTP